MGMGNLALVKKSGETGGVSRRGELWYTCDITERNGGRRNGFGENLSDEFFKDIPASDK